VRDGVSYGWQIMRECCVCSSSSHLFVLVKGGKDKRASVTTIKISPLEFVFIRARNTRPANFVTGRRSLRLVLEFEHFCSLTLLLYVKKQLICDIEERVVRW
jgi:hypothetical protein